jgi:beta-glucanase (GH16 family)
MGPNNLATRNYPTQMVMGSDLVAQQTRSSPGAAAHRRYTIMLAAILTLLIAVPMAPGIAVESGDSRAGEAVVNGSAATGLDGWDAAAQAGPVELDRVAVVKGPFGRAAAVQVSAARTGAWAMALVRLRGPQHYFELGRTYRMQLWVRDLTASGKSISVQLANGNFKHRPTEVSDNAKMTDRRWRLITRTFIASAPAHADTAFYIGLPTGAFTFQATHASVRPALAATPTKASTAPIRTITFSGPAGTPVDPAVWTHETGGRWGNGEQQTYTSRTSNSRLDGKGRLEIVVRRERFAGVDGVTRAYTSARLSTQTKVVLAPGSYVESSIVAPVGAGLWPAFWTLGVDIATVGWPASGELDIFEGIGSRPTVAHAAVHMASAADPSVDLEYGWGEAGGRVDLGVRIDSRPHRYGAYFDGATVRFYIDRRERMALWAADARASGRTWPFDRSQYLVVNVAIAGGVDASAVALPVTMTVGPISIWRGLPF